MEAVPSVNVSSPHSCDFFPAGAALGEGFHTPCMPPEPCPSYIDVAILIFHAN